MPVKSINTVSKMDFSLEWRLCILKTDIAWGLKKLGVIPENKVHLNLKLIKVAYIINPYTIPQMINSGPMCITDLFQTIRYLRKKKIDNEKH